MPLLFRQLLILASVAGTLAIPLGASRDPRGANATWLASGGPGAGKLHVPQYDSCDVEWGKFLVRFDRANSFAADAERC